MLTFVTGIGPAAAEHKPVGTVNDKHRFNRERSSSMFNAGTLLLSVKCGTDSVTVTFRCVYPVELQIIDRGVKAKHQENISRSRVMHSRLVFFSANLNQIASSLPFYF